MAEDASNSKVKVQVLGIRCVNCDKLYAHARQAAEEAGIPCEVERVRDIFRIIDIGPLGLPALVINGRIRSSGEVLSVAAIKELLNRKDEG